MCEKCVGINTIQLRGYHGICFHHVTKIKHERKSLPMFSLRFKCPCEFCVHTYDYNRSRKLVPSQNKETGILQYVLKVILPGKISTCE